ncbi:hypothetical protein, partial [Pectobacterium brasiliense]|uniref:hypothetical protein n=1 Tax=Pectobacterium brasiliense TaxID=180957 RepID=UPI0030164BA6
MSELITFLKSNRVKHVINDNGSITIPGRLDLECSGISSLPENLSVGEWLDISGCTGLTSLPENLSVGEWLDISGCTGLTSLPENLSVGGGLR